jgi:hypothetical protein
MEVLEGNEQEEQKAQKEITSRWADQRLERRRRQDGPPRSEKRTTIILTPEDQSNIEEISALRGDIPDIQVIRQSLRFTLEMMRWYREGGKIQLSKGRHKEVVRFM